METINEATAKKLTMNIKELQSIIDKAIKELNAPLETTILNDFMVGIYYKENSAMYGYVRTYTFDSVGNKFYFNDNWAELVSPLKQTHTQKKTLHDEFVSGYKNAQDILKYMSNNA